LRKDDPSDPSKKTYPWGNPPAGCWVYDRGGHFSPMISQNLPLAIPAGPFPVAGANNQPGWLSPAAPWQVPFELLMETFATARPYAYFGTYTVERDANDPARKGTIHHNVFSDVLRAYNGHRAGSAFCLRRPGLLARWDTGTVFALNG